MKLSEFKYDLPEKHIAQYPPEIRGTTRLIVLYRKTETIEHSKYANLDEFLSEGDCVVLNDTKVIPARLFATGKENGKRVEIFLLKNINPDENVWEVMLGLGKRVKKENFLVLEDGKTEVEIVQHEHGKPRLLKFPQNTEEIIKNLGHTPLPPYIKREDTKEDVERYQTVFAKESGAVAAPTASLNFTDELIKKLEDKGVKIVYVTLHVGWDTFAPITEDDVEEHEIHSEWISVEEKDAKVINEVKNAGGKVLAVGTTASRVLETVANDDGTVRTYTGPTEIYIYPGYKFKCVDMMLTNFHAPGSTVLLMAATFAGKDFLFRGYEEAKENDYKFLSYGDSMLIK